MGLRLGGRNDGRCVNSKHSVLPPVGSVFRIPYSLKINFLDIPVQLTYITSIGIEGTDWEAVTLLGGAGASLRPNSLFGKEHKGAALLCFSIHFPWSLSHTPLP